MPSCGFGVSDRGKVVDLAVRSGPLDLEDEDRLLGYCIDACAGEGCVHDERRGKASEGSRREVTTQ